MEQPSLFPEVNDGIRQSRMSIEEMAAHIAAHANHGSYTERPISEAALDQGRGPVTTPLRLGRILRSVPQSTGTVRLPDYTEIELSEEELTESRKGVAQARAMLRANTL
jgi:hypothetical protein